MAHSPSQAFLDQETLRQLLATWDQEREQAQAAAEDAQAEVERLSQANARLECELAHDKAQHSQLVCQLARCHAELLKFKARQQQPIASPLTDQDETTAHIAEELQATVEELQVTAEELENANTALRITNEDLERRVRERTAELEELEQAKTAAACSP
jgi:chromosome segregation ATPase